MKNKEVFFKERQKKLASLLKNEEIDALFVTNLVHIRYLTNFPGSAGFLLFIPEDPPEVFFFTDFRYQLLAKEQVHEAALSIEKNPREALIATIKEKHIKRIAIEAGNLNVQEFFSLKEKLADTQLIPLSSSKGVERVRLIKDAFEIEALKKAIAISAAGYEKTLQMFHSSSRKVTEREFASYLKCAFLQEGADTVSFEPIILTGPRSASPHAVCTDTPIDENHVLLMDFGVEKEGYMSDTTRCLLRGKTPENIRDIYTIVDEAKNRAVGFVRPGIEAKEIDAVCREYIRKAGFGDYFVHGTGHGVGLEIHESPRISSLDNTTVEAGMVFTIEPGIYIEKVGGIRLEEMVLVTENGAEILTKEIPY